MPLSEQEQRMLDEMERHLFADDPHLERAFRGSDRPRADRRRIVLGIIGVALGLGLLVLAVALPAIWLGVLSFVLMLASALFAVTGGTHPGSGEQTGAPGSTGSENAAGRREFMRRMEQRWERRSGPQGPR